jgi:pimeloyl-ACP methyl ester carboxylesterase
MYVRGNPLKYTDPSGHVAVCFQGGPQANNNKELDSSFYNFCTQSLLEAGYDEDQHGPILYYIYNGSAAKRDAINAILNRGANEPAIVIGYSYGGAAALEVAKELSTYVLYPSPLANEDIPKAYIDLLITIDPERIVRSAPRAVYDNVRLAINIAPVDGWKYEIGPFQGGNDSPINAQNGTNYVEGALNINIEEVYSSHQQSVVRMDHNTILNLGKHVGVTELNPRTLGFSTAAINMSLSPY